MGSACFYSGRLVGYVVGWINTETLCSSFIRQKDAPGMGDTVLAVKLKGGLQVVGCSGTGVP